MRVLAVLGLVLFLVLVGGASGLGMAFAMPRHAGALAGSLSTFATTLMWIGPFITGSLTYWYDSRASRESRRALRPSRIVSAVFAAIGACILVALVITVGLALWYVLAALLVSAALQVLAPAAAHRLGARARAADAAREFAPPDLLRLRRGRRIAAISGIAVALGAAAVGIPVLLAVDDRAGRAVPSALVLAGYLGVFVAALVLIIGTIRLNRPIRALFHGDLAMGQRVARHVLRGRGELDAEDVTVAARYAPVIAAHQVNTWIGLDLLAIGIAAIATYNVGTSRDSTWLITAGSGVFMLALSALGLARAHRAAVYARDHVDDLPPDERPASTG